MLPNLTSQKVAIPAALFLALSPGLLLTTDGSKVSLMNRKTSPCFSTVSCSSWCTLSSLSPWASFLPRNRSSRDHRSLHRPLPRSSSYPPSWLGRCLPVGTDQHSCRCDSRGCVRCGVRVTSQAISSVLLSRKMKYLVLGPASMGIFSLIGALKARETNLVDVKEISGSSAGAILALFLALGMSVDEILETSLSLNIPNFVKIRIGSFFNKFGFVDMGPIRKKFVEFVVQTLHLKK